MTGAPSLAETVAPCDRAVDPPILGGHQGAGSRPALLVIDLNLAFTDPTSPLHCDADAAVAATAVLLAAARDGRRTVVFTTLQYTAAEREIARAFLAKVPALAMLEPGTRWPLIDERIAPRADESVLFKLFASAFFATPLPALLASHGCDTVVVCGASTSGCVRATAVDGLQYGYRVMVPRAAVADRSPAAHEASLADIDAKYGDVVELSRAEALLRG